VNGFPAAPFLWGCGAGRKIGRGNRDRVAAAFSPCGGGHITISRKGDLEMVKISGGEGFEAKLAEIADGLQKAARLRVGFMEGSVYPDGTPVPLVAAINEFGQTRLHPNQPPRPFMRAAINEHADEWPAEVKALLIEHDYDAEKVLALMGETITAEIRESIIAFTTPGLAPSTIARKGFEKPLVDSGQMLKSVNYEVDSGSEPE
jgi:hypothetical protein